MVKLFGKLCAIQIYPNICLGPLYDIRSSLEQGSTGRKADRQEEGHTDRQAGRKAGGQEGRHPDRQIGRNKGRKTGRQVDYYTIHILNISCKQSVE